MAPTFNLLGLVPIKVIIVLVFGFLKSRSFIIAKTPRDISNL